MKRQNLKFVLTLMSSLFGFALLAALATPALADEGALGLAKKSGCLACHSVEKKVVGPAWQDVSARYKVAGPNRYPLPRISAISCF